jgi:hypothetical protein
MYRIVLVCYGLPASIGEQTAREVAADFAELGEFCPVAECEWKGGDVILRVETDDQDGILTLDYFRKCIEASSAGIVVGAGVCIESLEKIDDKA